MLEKVFDFVRIRNRLKMGKGAVIITTNSAGTESTVTLSELGVVDGVTAGTVTASKAVVVDSNKDIASFRNITATGTVTAGDIAGGDSSLDILGQAAAQGGSATLKGGASSTSGNAGGAASLTGGVPGATGNGGAANVTGGIGGATSGNGGAATVAGGAGTAGNGNGGSAYLKGGAPNGTGVYGMTALGVAAGLSAVVYGVVRSTVSNAGTVTDAQHRGMVLYQDASVGNVTMTTRTAAQLDSAFPDLVTGQAIQQFVASNHATNTSTIAGGTGVTLVGSGAVTQLGGSFLLVKTGTAAYDLVRVG